MSLNQDKDTLHVPQVHTKSIILGIKMILLIHQKLQFSNQPEENSIFYVLFISNAWLGKMAWSIRNTVGFYDNLYQCGFIWYNLMYINNAESVDDDFLWVFFNKTTSDSV